MKTCEVPSINQVGCPGHLGKFDDCLVEGLYELSLEPSGADASTGSSDFEGYMALIVVRNDSWVAIESIEHRQVAVPAGAYLLFESCGGVVTYMLADSEEQAREVFDVADSRHAAWERGCDPDDLDGHAECEVADSCLLSTWSVV